VTEIGARAVAPGLGPGTVGSGIAMTGPAAQLVRDRGHGLGPLPRIRVTGLPAGIPQGGLLPGPRKVPPVRGIVAAGPVVGPQLVGDRRDGLGTVPPR